MGDCLLKEGLWPCLGKIVLNVNCNVKLPRRVAPFSREESQNEIAFLLDFISVINSTVFDFLG